MLAALVSLANAGNALSPDDDEPNDQSEPDDDGRISLVMTVMSDVMAWILAMYEQYPVLFAMCIQVVLLVAMIGCFSACQRRNARTARPGQAIADAMNTDSPSPRAFNTPLNINIHMHQGDAGLPAPGTPARPYVLSESESAASSVASSMPASSNDAMPKASPPGARSKAAPKQVARRLATVWIPRNGGKRYHRIGCGKLSHSRRVDEVTAQDARARGYTACKVCQPTTE